MAKKKLIGRHDKVMDLTYGKKYNPKMKLNAAAAGDWLNVFSAAPSAIQGFVNNSDIKEREDLERRAQLGMSETFNGIQSLDALQAARNAYAPMPSLTRKDLVPTTRERIGNVFTATLGGVGAGLGTGNAGLAAGLGLLSGTVAGIGIARGNSKADDYLTRYRNDVNAAEERLQKAYNYQLGNIYDNSYNRLMANYSAAGGQLGRDGYPSRYSSASMPDVFTHGGIFSNGMELIDAGGSHEENPNGGVVVSYDPEGVPNIVEEGEVIFNDYVFSNRFGPTKNLLEKYKLPKEYEKYTFARLAEMMGRESKERPNDAISKRGLESSMDTLQSMQEEYKEIERQKEIARLIKRMTPEEKAAMFDAAAAQEQQMYGNPEEMYAAQEPQMEMPAFMPQEYALGGNIYKDGTDRLKKRTDRRARRNSGNSINIPAEWFEQSEANRRLAEELALALFNERGVKPTKAMLNEAVNELAAVRGTSPETSRYAAATPTINTYFQTEYASPSLEAFQNLAKRLGARTGGSESYRKFSDIYNRIVNPNSATEVQNLPELEEERAAAIEAAFEAGIGNNPFAGLSIEPPVGGKGGGRGSSPSAGSATKAAETKSGGLENPEEVTKRYMMEHGIVSPSAGKTLTDAMTAEYNNVLASRAGLTPEAKTAFAKRARGKGVGSDRESPLADDEGLPTWMRYAGAAADALGAVSSLLTPPDYTHARQIRNAGRPYGEVTFTPVENPLTFRPIDRNYVTNEMRNNSLGMARQLVNASGANPGVAVAGLAGLNYGTNQNIGQGFVQGDLGNFQMESQVKNFNRAGQQYNSEGMFNESLYNSYRFQPLTQPEILAAQMEAQEDALTAQARSENISNFTNALAAIGDDNLAYNMATSAPWLYYDYADNPWRRGTQKYNPAACGGKMKTKKKK